MPYVVNSDRPRRLLGVVSEGPDQPLILRAVHRKQRCEMPLTIMEARRLLQALEEVLIDR